MSGTIAQIIAALARSPIALVTLGEVVIVLILIRELVVFRKTPLNDPNRSYNVFNSCVLLFVGGILLAVPSAIERQVALLDKEIVRYPMVTSGTADALLWGVPGHWILYTPDSITKVAAFYEDLAHANDWKFLSQSDGKQLTLLMESPGKRVFIVLSQVTGGVTQIHYALAGIVQVTTATTTIPVQ